MPTDPIETKENASGNTGLNRAAPAATTTKTRSRRRRRTTTTTTRTRTRTTTQNAVLNHVGNMLGHVEATCGLWWAMLEPDWMWSLLNNGDEISPCSRRQQFLRKEWAATACVTSQTYSNTCLALASEFATTSYLFPKLWRQCISEMFLPLKKISRQETPNSVGRNMKKRDWDTRIRFCKCPVSRAL